NKQVKRLSQVLHSNSVQNALLKHEVMSLREALVNERTRRKRGKALPLLEPEEYNGRAIVWSPRKVREARGRQQQQKLEEEQQKLQKAEAKRLRGDKRQAKAEAVQLRRQVRAEARLLREKERAERAERAADQASQAAAHRTTQQLKKALKTSQKASQKASKTTFKNRVGAEGRRGREPSGAIAGAPPVQSHLGRKIVLPTKYQ
ncbi:hypothetical protein EJ02DRAFT_498183, partial [Clathrospora elynae]